uniref:Uncharacterized protein n=1 Tax=Lotus japonicus TaxID=34305 RepID=I3S7D4_LOTJA|nr:unknown [Lotus japonicus]
MFKSLSTRPGPSKYEKMDKDSAAGGGTSNEEMTRSTSVPSSSATSMALGSSSINLHRNPTKRATNNPKEKSHPIFSLFEFRRKKKATAKPEFARYLEYMKEGGMWDVNSNQPVIYFK